MTIVTPRLGRTPRDGLFSWLFAADLVGFIGAVQATIDHYSQQLPVPSGL
jgi:hypothetical protein